MSPTATMRTWLLTFPAITDITQEITVPPVQADTTMPCIILQHITGRDLEDLEGSTDLPLRTIMQVMCYSNDFEVANQLRVSIKASVRGQRDVIITGSEWQMDAINHNGDRNLWDERIRKHVALVDFLIWWEHV